MSRTSREGSTPWPWAALVVGGALAVLAAGCAAAAPTPPAKPPAAHAAAEEAPKPRPIDSDATAELFLTALMNRDFGGAAARFDAQIKAALPQEKLAAIWDAQIASLGPLRSWRIAQRARTDDQDVRVAMLTFERAQLQAVIAIRPPAQEVSGFFLRPVPAAPYVNASAFRTEDVSIGEEPFVLQGTLSVPVGKGPFPGAILVHGSGPHDRDESVGPNRPFKDLAEGLASRGIAVLRYDKRTFQYGRQLTGISIDDEVVLDAVAAANLLKRRPEIDARRVFVIGHSLGALLAPEIAVRAAPVAGAILLAPQGRAPWDLVLAQMRYLDTPADKIAEIEKAFERLEAGELAPGEMLLGAPASYWRDWAARDGVAMARKLRRPILILRGERDYQVTDEDLATWRSGLRGVADVELVTIPGANHLFIQGTGKPGPAEYAIAGHVDEAVIARLAAFISGGKRR